MNNRIVELTPNAIKYMNESFIRNSVNVTDEELKWLLDYNKWIMSNHWNVNQISIIQTVAPNLVWSFYNMIVQQMVDGWDVGHVVKEDELNILKQDINIISMCELISLLSVLLYCRRNPNRNIDNFEIEKILRIGLKE